MGINMIKVTQSVDIKQSIKLNKYGLLTKLIHKSESSFTKQRRRSIKKDTVGSLSMEESTLLW